MSTEKTIKNNKAATISLRLSGDLKSLVDQALVNLGESKTEFLETAIKDRIRNLAKTDDKIKKMVEATVKKVSAID